MKKTICFIFISILFLINFHFLEAQGTNENITPPSSLSAQEQKLMDKARKILGKEKPKYFSQYEHFCNLGLGEGRELTEATSKGNYVGKQRYDLVFHIFYWKNGKVVSDEIGVANYRTKDLKIIRFPNAKKDSIWVGEDDYGSGGECHLFSEADGRLKEILTYPGSAQEPTGRIGYSSYLLPGANRTLVVLMETEDDRGEAVSLEFSSQAYAWNDEEKSYKPTSSKDKLSLIEAVLIAWVTCPNSLYHFLSHTISPIC